MRKYLFIGGGGFAGAALRFFIKGTALSSISPPVWFHTLGINLTGAFLIAFLLTLAANAKVFDENALLGTTVGFLGSFTTFSGLCRETVLLLREGSILSAVCYPAASVLLGLGAACLGAVMARKLGSMRRVKRRDTGVLSQSEGGNG